ncbi:LDLRAP1 [Branchiostoma lanceolatum]|uniref:LDLRAP1 protein n=1 Tax=Branchiostoma lanceolatum TaxID=7740 RepID=A0A8J9VZX4_BRALA|nr:LDLRAP1 [Branchiostoma lanceolatum]
MPPHYTHRTNGVLRNGGFSEETAETNMAYSPTRRISGYATDTTDDAICPIFHVRYLGRGPVAAAGRDYVSPIVDSLFRQAARKHLPKTTLFISAQGIRVGQPRGGRSAIPVSFVPIHDCLYGAADRIHKEVFSIVVKGTGRGNPFECMSFVCHKSAHSTALALWLNKAFKEAYEVWQTQTVRPADPRGIERNVRRNPSFQHQPPRPVPVEDQYAAYSSVDRGQRRYQRSNSESVYVNGDYRSEPLGEGLLYRGGSNRYSAAAPAYPPQKRKDSEKEGSGFGSFFRRSKRGSERGSREVVYTPPDHDSTKNSPRRSSFSLPDKAPWKKREKKDEKEKKKKDKKKHEDLYTPRGERFVYRNPELSYSVETLDDVSIQSEDRGRSGRRYLRKQRTQSEEREKPPSPVAKRPLSHLLQPTPFTVALEKKASPEPTKREAQIPKKRTSNEKSLSDERRQPPKKPSPQPTLETHSVPPPPLQPAPKRPEEPKPQQNGEIDFSGIVDTDAFIDDVFDGIDYDIFSDDDQKQKRARDNSEEHASEKARDASNKENWPDFSTAYISPTSARGSQDIPRWTNIFGKTPPPGMSPESGAKFSQYQPKALRGDAADVSRADVERARQQPTGSERKRHDSEDDGYTSIVVKENEAPVRYSQALNDYEQGSRGKPNGVINNHYDSKGSGDVKNLYNLVGSKSFWETRVDMGKSMLY